MTASSQLRPVVHAEKFGFPTGRFPELQTRDTLLQFNQVVWYWEMRADTVVELAENSSSVSLNVFHHWDFEGSPDLRVALCRLRL